MCPNEADTTAQPDHDTAKKSVRRLQSGELFGDQREVLIEHEGCCYCLRLTRQNKLILTK